MNFNNKRQTPVFDSCTNNAFNNCRFFLYIDKNNVKIATSKMLTNQGAVSLKCPRPDISPRYDN